MGRVFFNTRKHMQALTADYQALASDSNTVFLINPASTTTLSLPTLADAGEGWNCKVVVTEGIAGAVGGMDALTKIDFGTGIVIIGMIVSQSDVAGDYAASGDLFVNITAAASPGDMVEIFTDGNVWYCHGMAVDATPGTGDVLFAAS